MSPQRVLLTGATGFIGQRLQGALSSHGCKVTAAIRPDSANRSRVLPGTDVLEAGLSDSERLAPAIESTDAVVYLAGTVRGRSPADFRAANVDGVAHLAACLNRSDRRPPVLLISSLAATRPELSDYARSKHEGEQTLRKLARFPWSIFQPPAVYGPGDREMLPILRLAARGILARPGPAGQRLSLLHVDDLARAVLAWLDHWPECQGQVYTLDDGRPGGYDWAAIGRAAGHDRPRVLGIPGPFLAALARGNLALSGLLGYAPMLTPGKVRELTQEEWLCDNTALTRATGWEPEIDLEAGLRRLIQTGEPV